MEVRGAGGEAPEDRSLNLADMGEVAVNQGLAEIARGSAVVARLTVYELAHRDLRQIADIQPAQIDGCIRGTGVPGADIQGRREGMVAYVRLVMARAAGSSKRWNTAGDQSALRNIVVDAGHPRDGNGSGVG